MKSRVHWRLSDSNGSWISVTALSSWTVRTHSNVQKRLTTNYADRSLLGWSELNHDPCFGNGILFVKEIDDEISLAEIFRLTSADELNKTVFEVSYCMIAFFVREHGLYFHVEISRAAKCLTGSAEKGKNLTSNRYDWIINRHVHQSISAGDYQSIVTLSDHAATKSIRRYLTDIMIEAGWIILLEGIIRSIMSFSMLYELMIKSSVFSGSYMLIYF